MQKRPFRIFLKFGIYQLKIQKTSIVGFRDKTIYLLYFRAKIFKNKAFFRPKHSILAFKGYETFIDKPNIKMSRHK